MAQLWHHSHLEAVVWTQAIPSVRCCGLVAPRHLTFYGLKTETIDIAHSLALGTTLRLAWPDIGPLVPLADLEHLSFWYNHIEELWLVYDTMMTGPPWHSEETLLSVGRAASTLGLCGNSTF